MATIRFKTKVVTVYNMDGSEAYQCVRVPTLTRNHCDMSAFRKHPRYGGLANSDLFPGILRRIRDSVLPNRYSNELKLHELPDNVSVDTGGFLAVVTIEAA